MSDPFEFNQPIQIKATTPALGKYWKCTDSEGNGEWAVPDFVGLVVSKTGNYTISDSESGTVFTNEGATGLITLTLPAAATQLQFIFVHESTTNGANIKIQAASGDTIRINTTVSSSGGYVQSGQVGETILLVAINATEWIAISGFGFGTSG